MTWYQRIYYNFLISLKKANILVFKNIFIFFNVMFYIIFFYFTISHCLSSQIINCTFSKNEFLIYHKIGNHFIYADKNLEFEKCVNLINYIKNTELDINNFNICFYKNLNGNFFPKISPFSHPNLLFLQYNTFDNEILVNIQMSSNNYNNWNIISKKNIINQNKNQYISNCFNFYKNNAIQQYNFKKNLSSYFLNNIDNKTLFKNYVNGVIRRY